jgi:hypothetical protein
MGGTNGAEIGLLDEILRLDRVAGEPAGEIVEGVEVAQRFCWQSGFRRIHEQRLSGSSSFRPAKG